MKNIVILVFFCLGILPISAQKNESKELRILCYNVHHCNPPSKSGLIDIAAIANVINNAKPDLVALQEIDVRTARSGKNLNQAEELAKLTRMHFHFTKAIDFDGGEYGVAILSRYPIEEKLSFNLPMAEGVRGEPRAVTAVRINVNGKDLYFASTHLDLKEENQKVQINDITDYISRAEIPVIFAGDLNARPDSYVVNELDKVLRRTCMDCPFTFPENNPNIVIDYIAFSPKSGFDILEHTVINETYASDHLPIFARLRMK